MYQQTFISGIKNRLKDLKQTVSKMNDRLPGFKTFFGH
jgi:hypothetical protein